MPKNRNNIYEHYNSMMCNPGVIKEDKLYIIIDDVFTFGEQMAACCFLLHDFGVPETNIVGIALGKTVLAKRFASRKGVKIDWENVYNCYY